VPALSNKTPRRPREQCPAVPVFAIFSASGGRSATATEIVTAGSTRCRPGSPGRRSGTTTPHPARMYDAVLGSTWRGPRRFPTWTAGHRPQSCHGPAPRRSLITVDRHLVVYEVAVHHPACCPSRAGRCPRSWYQQQRWPRASQDHRGFDGQAAGRVGSASRLRGLGPHPVPLCGSQCAGGVAGLCGTSGLLATGGARRPRHFGDTRPIVDLADGRDVS
jgi:hypothetical protein